MKTVDYKLVLRSLAAQTSQTLDELEPGTAAFLMEALGTALEAGYDEWAWPQLMTVEERYFHAGVWSAGTWAAGSIVYYTDGYYQASKATTEEPSSAANDWAAVTNMSWYIEESQPGKERIGRLTAVYNSDPRTDGAAARLPYERISGLGYYLPRGPSGATVWLRYAPVTPNWKAQTFTAGMALSAGDSIYYATDGKCYECELAQSSAVAPSSANAILYTDGVISHTPVGTVLYRERPIPEFLQAFAKYEAYADWLESPHEAREDIDSGKQRAKARQLINDQKAVIARQENQLPRTTSRSPGRRMYAPFH